MDTTSCAETEIQANSENNTIVFFFIELIFNEIRKNSTQMKREEVELAFVNFLVNIVFKSYKRMFYIIIMRWL